MGDGLALLLGRGLIMPALLDDGDGALCDALTRRDPLAQQLLSGVAFGPESGNHLIGGSARVSASAAEALQSCRRDTLLRASAGCVAQSMINTAHSASSAFSAVSAVAVVGAADGVVAGCSGCVAGTGVVAGAEEDLSEAEALSGAGAAGWEGVANDGADASDTASGTLGVAAGVVCAGEGVHGETVVCCDWRVPADVSRLLALAFVACNCCASLAFSSRSLRFLSPLCCSC